MDLPDRAQESLPAWPASTPQVPVLPLKSSWEDLSDLDASAPPKALTLKIALRAVRRHWWRILALWLIGSGALMAVTYYKVKPTYEATAYLKVEPSNRSIIGPAAPQFDFGPYMETQVQLITSPDVLDAAAHHEKVAELPRIRSSADPELELRKLLRVAIPPKTHLILVSMSSESRDEAAIIVNAVVEAYLKAASTWVDTDTRQEIKQLTELKKKFKAEVEQKREDAVFEAVMARRQPPMHHPALVYA